MDRIALLAWLAFGLLPVFIYALATRQLRLSDLKHGGHFAAMILGGVFLMNQRPAEV